MDLKEFDLTEWISRDDSVVENKVLPKDFADYVSTDVVVDTRNTLEAIQLFWLQIGLSTTEMVDRMEEIKALHMSINKNSLATERSTLQKLILYNETTLKEINVILHDLTLSPFAAPTDRSLKQIGRILFHKHKELEELKKERLNQMSELKAKRDPLLKIMSLEAKEWRTATNIPSDEELMHLKSYVSDLTKERLKRFHKYQSLRKIIEHLFAELEREVMSDFEKHLLLKESKNFILSDEHMKRLQSLHSEIEFCYQKNNEKKKLMDRKLSSLWNKLKVEQSYRDVFYRNKNGCKPSVLALLEEEVRKYEELKRQNIKMFVEKVREELEVWYDKCFTSDQQKDKFRPFLESIEFNEELLECHENELQRLQTYYEEYKEVFEKVKEWDQMWNRYKELEQRATDPNRFSNRGGALLTEEREKNRIHKKLQKLENMLKKMSDERETPELARIENPAKQYLKNQKMNYQDIKDNEKKERQRVKQMEVNAQLNDTKIVAISGVVSKSSLSKRAFTLVSVEHSGESEGKIHRIVK